MPEELLQACLKNDPEARRQFIVSHYGSFLALSRRYAKSNEQADIFFQQAFIDVFKTLVEYRKEQNFDEWLKDTFVSSLIRQLKNCKAEYYVTTTTKIDDAKKAEPDLFHSEDEKDINLLGADAYISALQKLPASFRAVFNMHVIEQYSINRVSAMLEVSESSAQNTLERARNQFSKNLQKQMHSYA
jgi:RNA polymerase sigma-70 factor, ECF subfamily